MLEEVDKRPNGPLVPEMFGREVVEGRNGMRSDHSFDIWFVE